jgi:prepilin-type N-terminal cleavage/methylation domain-containing protein
MTQKQKQKGFTLVELIVVIAIVAILAATAIVGYRHFINKAEESALMQEVEGWQKAIQGHFLGGTVHSEQYSPSVSGHNYNYKIDLTHDFVSDTFTMRFYGTSGDGIDASPSRKATNMNITFREALEEIFPDLTVKPFFESGHDAVGTLSVSIASYDAEIVTFTYHHSEDHTVTWTAGLNVIDN